MTTHITCSVFIATSVDGFIAREDDSLDFLPPGGGEEHGYTAFISSVDAVVMGRRTFEKVLTFDKWPFTKPVVVLSSRPPRAKLPNGAVIKFMSGEPRAVVARLAERGMRHLYVDGGVTIQRFLEAGLIGRMTITRVPVLIGRGIPLFGQLSRDIRLEHVATRTYPSGLVTSEYLVARG
ncbi:MAG TPA: dihydrofolate reductase family protein [Acidobacteriota bacterium]|jgi:dihydrofolate reductase|nr:dihydrofolate reductase family protein [Acidobacteriota bacterium]